MSTAQKNTFAIWAITPNGVKLALKIAAGLPGSVVYVSAKLADVQRNLSTFLSLSAALAESFHCYAGHVFIMASGIVIRVIAPFIRSKLSDPAVVVVDDQGCHAVSLLSGHLGGANALTQAVATIISAHPVITTATDVNQIAAIDVLAKDRQLSIENPDAIKVVNMALLSGAKIRLHDPFGLVQNALAHTISWPDPSNGAVSVAGTEGQKTDAIPGIFIDDVRTTLEPNVLILRPQTLLVGIGCNRNAPVQEIKHLLEHVLEQNHLAPLSLRGIASIRLKADEHGLLALANHMNLPLTFFEKKQLNHVKEIKTPSAMVEKHVGVKSVCEAAAILAAQGGTLVVPKQTSRNVTVAVARIRSTSLASVPDAPSI